MSMDIDFRYAEGLAFDDPRTALCSQGHHTPSASPAGIQEQLWPQPFAGRNAMVDEDAARALAGDATAAWLFLRAGRVPEKWRDRGVAVTLLPLLPDEVSELLDGGSVQPSLDPTTGAVAQLAARGLTVAAMARELDMSSRSVDRHLARLREEFGVGSTAELAVELAKRGF